MITVVYKVKSFLFDLFAWIGAPLLAVILYGFTTTTHINESSTISISSEMLIDNSHQTSFIVGQDDLQNC